MPITYVCNRCHKTYSKKDFEESKLCITCGSILLQKLITKSYLEATAEELSGNNSSPKKQEASGSDNLSQEKTALMRAAESLRQKVTSTSEYSIISECNTDIKASEKITPENWIWNTEYDNALNLEKHLIHQFKNKTLEEAIPGKVVSNEQGDCFSISSASEFKFKKADWGESRHLIISDLKIIPGIGPVRERVLKQQGYKTIEALTTHPLWRNDANAFMKLLDAQKIEPIQDWFGRRLPKSHPLVHYLAGLCNDEDFAIIDIETLGLSERPIVLLGIAKPSKKTISTEQYLLRDVQDEPSAIWALISQFEPCSSLITFNGRSFDIPYIKQRLAYYGMDASLNNPHFDMLHFTRRALGKRLSDCRLETVEKKYLGFEREIDIPGALVPHFYDTYLRTRNVGPLVAIVKHNKQDLITLGTLFSRLYEEWSL